ncbi:hypothetical protein [Actinomarinicola tropica]|uniref:SnoaL-like domain-containing protein n=1 Tax=Actinomarinicola tropica TaxID=2789776 RepID=A0A5Q2RQY4_9ACTN|nr:hypothetical protein [Actinomarinicola tropica]QGG96310.1 hypothetical protein GH723_15060 [Actinomarinicola tropica]
MLVLALGACSSDDADGPDEQAGSTTTSTTAATTTTSTTLLLDRLPADESLETAAQVEAAYLHHWGVVLVAFDELDPDLLELVLTGELLQVRRDQIAHLDAEGQRITGTLEHDVTVEVVSETEAMVTDTQRSHLVTVDADGEAVSDDDGATSINEYTLVRDGDAWLVASAVQKS